MKLFGIQAGSGIKNLIAISLILGISACASNKNVEEDPAAAGGVEDSKEVSTQGTDDGDVSTVSNKGGSSLSGYDDLSPAEQASLLKQREFFFAFDSFSLTSEGKRALTAHGRFLAKTPAARVRLEGHTDERGTREYNLALGERRAKAAKQVLMSAGAQSRQIEVITYGEERPRAEGSNEAAYKQNRRVDIKYTVSAP